MLIDDEGNDREFFEETYFELIASIKRIILDFNLRHSVQTVETAQSVSPVAAEVNSALNICLPKLDLPKFSGKYEDWFPFYKMFNAATNDNRFLSNFHKF